MKRGRNRIPAMLREIQKGGARAAQVGYFDPEIAGRASANEYGTINIPERSFVRSTADAGDVKADLVSKARSVLKQGFDKTAALQAMGSALVDHIKAKIDSVVPPPNAPATIAKKGHGHTLIETKEMRNSTSARIV